MFFNENLYRFYPFDADFVQRHRSSYTEGQLVCLRSGIIDCGVVLYSTAPQCNLWTDGILDKNKPFSYANEPQPEALLQSVQGRQVTLTINGLTVSFNFTSSFQTDIVYFNGGYAFLTSGVLTKLIDTIFTPPIELYATRIVSSSNKRVTSLTVEQNVITDKTIMFENGQNCRCYTSGNDLYIAAVNNNTQRQNINGLISLFGATGRSISITASPEFTVSHADNVVTLAINEDLFNNKHCSD